VPELGNSLVKEDLEVLETIAESDITGQKIRGIADRSPESGSTDPLTIRVVVTGTPRTAGGNHRATGLALYMAQGGVLSFMPSVAK
jgi:hypothetical protein